MPRSASWLGCLLVALAVCSLPAGAQGAAPVGSAAVHPRYGTKPPVAAGDWNLFSGIELTHEQEVRIATAYRGRLQQLFLLSEKSRHPDNRAAMTDSIALVQRAQLAEMRAALTPSQQARFDLNVAGILARARQRRASATSSR